ncbi:MAG TPA: hypothetical protein VE090_03470 [Methylomirabilota bacterium]|nr:hypothetical protein [Methylomirabilota bacterium]
MDDTSQNQNTSATDQPVQQSAPADAVANPSQSQAAPAAQIINRRIEEPPTAISGGHPEQGPIAMDPDDDEDEDEQPVAKQEAPRLQQSHPTEVVLPPEVKELGVEAGTDAKEQQLAQEVQEAGVSFAKETTPVFTPPQKEPEMPMTYQEAEQLQKTNIRDSKRWLGKMVMYVIEKLYGKPTPVSNQNPEATPEAQQTGGTT